MSQDVSNEDGVAPPGRVGVWVLFPTAHAVGYDLPPSGLKPASSERFPFSKPKPPPEFRMSLEFLHNMEPKHDETDHDTFGFDVFRVCWVY